MSMFRTHRIAVADDDQPSRGELVSWLVRAGHSVVIESDSAEELVGRCCGAAIELIIADARLLKMPGLAGTQELSDELDAPVIAISREIDGQMVDSTGCSRVFAHLMKPLRESEILAAVPLAVARYRETRALREETINMQRALEDRKCIERAKGIIMHRQGVDEATAFRHLQQLARNHRLKMADVARSIILAHGALNSPDVTGPHSLSSDQRNDLPRRRSG